MVICEISQAGRYYNIDPRLEKALRWISEHYKDTFTPGSYDLGDGITANAQTPAMQSAENARLEAHRRYLDIHVPMREETMGWAPVESLRNVIEPYTPEADFELFGDSAHCLFPVRPGQIAIFWPEDAHAPNIGTGSHRKYCVKVPVD